MSLLPPPCDEFTTSEPLRSATRVSPPGHDRHPVAVEDVRPQVDVPGLDAAVDEARGARERQRRLGDEVARVGEDLVAEFVAFACGAVRTDQHPVAAGFADRLHDQRVQMLEHVGCGPTDRRADRCRTFDRIGSSDR